MSNKKTMKPRILLVDDDDNLLAGLRRMLRTLGCDWELVFAGNGHEALEQLTCAPFDVVVTDLFMPKKEGLETIRELRGLYPELKIIAISGGGSTKNAMFLDMAKNMGAHYTLYKPFHPRELIEAVNGILPKSHLRLRSGVSRTATK